MSSHSIQFLQSQMIGMQTSLDRILSAVDPGAPHQQQMAPPPPGYPPPGMEPPRDPSGMAQPPRPGFEIPAGPIVDRARAFPPLPGFAPPVSIYNLGSIMRMFPLNRSDLQPHKYASYGIIPSTAASSEDESEDTLPRSTLNAPIEALQGLANAAAEAAAAPSAMSPRYV